jgi:serine/threonine-protein kinase
MSKVLVCAQCGRQFTEPATRCSADGSALCGPEALTRIGQALGSYNLEKIEGVGGMGVVYRGRHVMLGKPVAVKVLHERFLRRDGAVEQFLREAQAASRIRHPNIIDVTDFGIAPDGSVYFVMEYLEGISLEDVLARDGRVPLFNAVNIVRQVARALAAAHDEGIVHRDLKPENIYLISREGRRRVVRRVADQGAPTFVVEQEGNFDFVKLLDFGVAKFTLDDVGPGMSTRAGMIFGTPHYMSPEQARGEAVDGRSDIYALGIVFYEMLTSAVPFDGEAALDILNGHVYGEVIPPRLRCPSAPIDENTDQTIMRCLEKAPDRRYQTMWELVDALQECFTDQVFLRDAHRLPGAVEAGIVPPPVPPPLSALRTPGAAPQPAPPAAPLAPRKSGITDELSELFAGRDFSEPPLSPPPSQELAVPLLRPKPGRERITEETAPPVAEEPARSNTSPGLGALTETMLESYDEQRKTAPHAPVRAEPVEERRKTMPRGLKPPR